MADARHTHRYGARLDWSGSTGAGYDAFNRTHTAHATGAEQGLTLASDSAFRGDPSLLNPEQLLVLAASSCQLLSFLAVAARARIDVVAYEDDASGEMPEDDRPMRLTRIQLQPRITIAGALPAADRLHRLVDLAHRECYVANSLRAEITVEPTFLTADGHDG